MAYLHWAKTTSLSDEFFKFNVPFILSGRNDQRKFSLSYLLSTTVKTPLQGNLWHNVWPWDQSFTVLQYTHLYDVQHASVVVSKLFLVEETPFLVLGRHRFHATLPVFALQHDRLKAHRERKTLRVNVLPLFLTVNESTSSVRDFFGLFKGGYTPHTIVIITRMHSSRMRTVRCSGCLLVEGGLSAQEGVCPGRVSVRRPPLWTESITDRCKNITLPQLRCGR